MLQANQNTTVIIAHPYSQLAPYETRGSSHCVVLLLWFTKYGLPFGKSLISAIRTHHQIYYRHIKTSN